MKPPIAGTRPALAGYLATLVALCCFGSPVNIVAQTADQDTGIQFEPARMSSAIDSAAAYLLRACADNGRFTYRVDLNPSIQPKPRYNILRHAGAIYALAQYHERRPDHNTRNVLLRAGSFLKQTIRPVAGNRHLLAVWSLPEINGTETPRQAKLGGTGLGLAALLSIEKIEPGFSTMDDLRRLGRFILYMQKADGSFYSKFYPDAGGRNDQWTSMYYPGEAALGLLMLYERDPRPQWLGAASKALGSLARTGGQRPRTLPDQWVLLASAACCRTTRQSPFWCRERYYSNMLGARVATCWRTNAVKKMPRRFEDATPTMGARVQVPHVWRGYWQHFDSYRRRRNTCGNNCEAPSTRACGSWLTVN